jgi:hypothetical protein
MRQGPLLTPDPSGSSGGSSPLQEPPKPKIHFFDKGAMAPKGEDGWARATTASGAGASHVKSFHCKLQGESIEYMDEQINKWLEAHPDYEVKFATTSIGEFAGKMGKEICMIVNVWV